MKTKVLIFGTSESSIMAHRYLLNDSDYEVLGFFVDDKFLPSSAVPGFEVMTTSKAINLLKMNDVRAFAPISGGHLSQGRKDVYTRLKTAGVNFVNYISSRAYFDAREIGENNFILENNVIQFNVSIGSNNIFWSGNHIGHSSRIGSHNFISSHVVISGRVVVNDSCFFGVNSCFADGIEIGSSCFVPAGALVAKSLNADSRVRADVNEIATKRARG